MNRIFYTIKISFYGITHVGVGVIVVITGSNQAVTLFNKL